MTFLPRAAEARPQPGPAGVAQPDRLVGTVSATPLARRGLPDTSTTPTSRALDTIRSARWRDSNDDQAPPTAQRDLRRLSVVHNEDTGSITATLTLAAAPTDAAPAAVMAMLLGTVNAAGECDSSLALVSRPQVGPAEWQSGASAEGAGTYRREGTTVTLRAKAPALARTATCAFAVVQESGPADPVVYDQTGYVRLREVPRPDLRLVTEDRTQTSAVVGRTRTVKVNVTNDGEAKARGVRVRVRAQPGLRVRPRVVTLPAIAADRDRTASFRVTLTRRATRDLTITASAKQARSRSARLVVHPVGRPLKSGLLGSYRWATRVETDYAWRNFGIAFVSRKLAYVGFPRAGVPTCRRVTGGPRKDGCVRWSYAKKSGKVTVGGRTGTYRKGRLQLGQLGYQPMKVPAGGSQWNVSLAQQAFRGCVPLQPCVTITNTLRLTTKGTFRATTTSTFTAPRTQPDLPPGAAKGDPRTVQEGKGRYVVGPNGRITFTFANGRKQVETIGIDTDAAERPDPYREGLVIDETNYYD